MTGVEKPSKSPGRSRTLYLTDEDWAEICRAADHMGLGDLRSRAVAKLARDFNDKFEREEIERVRA